MSTASRRPWGSNTFHCPVRAPVQRAARGLIALSEEKLVDTNGAGERGIPCGLVRDVRSIKADYAQESRPGDSELKENMPEAKPYGGLIRAQARRNLQIKKTSWSQSVMWSHVVLVFVALATNRNAWKCCQEWRATVGQVPSCCHGAVGRIGWRFSGRQRVELCGYYITRDNKLILASDAGVLDVKDVDIIETTSPKGMPRLRESVSM